jgi:hypothetical protein
MEKYSHIKEGNNYPKEITELIAEKRRARKRWQQTRTPADKTRNERYRKSRMKL